MTNTKHVTLSQPWSNNSPRGLPLFVRRALEQRSEGIYRELQLCVVEVGGDLFAVEEVEREVDYEADCKP